MQRKNLALRVLSTAAMMSIVTSIAAPAFADVYYIGNGSIDVKTMTGENGSKYVEVRQGDYTYTDTSDEIVIKDGTDEESATQQEKYRIEGKKAEVAVPNNEHPATQELETTGPAAGEGQPDPDADFTLSEEEEQGKDPTDNTAANPAATPTENPATNPTDNTTEPPKKDAVYQYAPADPEPEQQATKLTLSVSDAPTAETKEATQDDTPTTTASAEGSAGNPSKNVIKVVNDWVGKVLNIRLSNVNICPNNNSTYADGSKPSSWTDGVSNVSGMTVKGSGNTKLELDGKNVLDSTNVRGIAGLYKDDGEGSLTITDETNDRGEKITSAKTETDGSGSLTAETSGGNSGAAIGGVCSKGTKNIIIEGYATVNAFGGYDGAGIGGGGMNWHESGNAENIIIQGHSNVTATSGMGAAIGGGSPVGTGDDYHGGSAKGIQIYDHATVKASTNSKGAAIGAAGDSGDITEAEVTIGTAGATEKQEDVHVTATSEYGAAIGNGIGHTNVTIQGHSTIENAKGGSAAIGRYGHSNYRGNTTVTIKDNATIKKAETSNEGDNPAIGGTYESKVEVNIEDNAHLVEVIGAIGSSRNTIDTTVNISGNAKIDTIKSKTVAIGDTRQSDNKVTVNIDGGKNGNVVLGDVGGISGDDAAIYGTSINIGDHVLIKMKQKSWYSASAGRQYSKYLSEKNDEKNLTSVSGVSDNTALWYTDCFDQLQKIVHGKNFCKKNKIDQKDANCMENGWVECGCTYEHDNHAVGQDHSDKWKEIIPALDHIWTDNGNDSTHICDRDHVTTQDHSYGEWTTVTAATCTTPGTEEHSCSVCGHKQTRTTSALGHTWTDNGSDSTHICVRGDVTEDHSYGEWTVVTPATCTTAGQKQRTCTECGHVETQEIPATGHHWVDNGDGTHGCNNPGCTEKHPHNWVDNGNGTHTCTDCGATEALPSKALPADTNSALELRVVDAKGMDQPFTVSQNGTLRTYTGAYDIATLTGDLDTLCYLQDHGAQTIQFVTNGQTSCFDINDLLAQGSGSEVFYLTHRGAEEPTLLLVEADHSELVKD